MNKENNSSFKNCWESGGEQQHEHLFGFNHSKLNFNTSLKYIFFIYYFEGRIILIKYLSVTRMKRLNVMKKATHPQETYTHTHCSYQINL